MSGEDGGKWRKRDKGDATSLNRDVAVNIEKKKKMRECATVCTIEEEMKLCAETGAGGGGGGYLPIGIPLWEILHSLKIRDM